MLSTSFKAIALLVLICFELMLIKFLSTLQLVQYLQCVVQNNCVRAFAVATIFIKASIVGLLSLKTKSCQE